MRISLLQVKAQFEALLAGRVSREAVNEWAFQHIQALDYELLEFDPPEDEQEIWDLLNYLYGIDMKMGPERYAIPENAIREVLKEKLSFYTDLNQDPS